jgi:nucleotidyltransferase/DNA polymerase involved in DNA repair
VRRVLFDENMPRQLRRDLSEFTVRTVQEEGWAGLENGNLLRHAAPTFDVLLTADQRIRYQQSVSKFTIGIVVIETFDTRLRNLRRFIPQLREAIAKVAAGTVLIIPTA